LPNVAKARTGLKHINGLNAFKMAKKDISGREDLQVLMDAFYKRLLADPAINYLFTDVARINILEHLPVLVDFWDSILFQSDTYRKNAMQPHMVLHSKSPLQSQHFETWLKHFNATVDGLFEGEIAFLAKQLALSIATMIELKTSRVK